MKNIRYSIQDRKSASFLTNDFSDLITIDSIAPTVSPQRRGRRQNRSPHEHHR